MALSSKGVWRHVTETIWSSTLPPRKWWQKVFSLLDCLHKENSHENIISLHKYLLLQNITKSIALDIDSINDIGINEDIEDDYGEVNLDLEIDSNEATNSDGECDPSVNIAEAFNSDTSCGDALSILF
ncbi:hypothetical protein L873DRAFT_1842099 [Choiromyces venosus 120613-1]|uniref:Uncharacterized protein n=1 Tax=Choiromyces venosus 120613-1 TaxID=1336337 RepID=A0A3N4JUQ0_9PEZI|nr:hypothetical protein L873DRAFT_1842099 [Choiromyces venosus 120613-1]